MYFSIMQRAIHYLATNTTSLNLAVAALAASPADELQKGTEEELSYTTCPTKKALLWHLFTPVPLKDNESQSVTVTQT